MVKTKLVVAIHMFCTVEQAGGSEWGVSVDPVWFMHRLCTGVATSAQSQKNLRWVEDRHP